MGTGGSFAALRMTEALPLPGELRACAAGGRRSKLAISAAVGECKDQRKPAAFSGHRKAGDTGRAQFPQRSKNARVKEPAAFFGYRKAGRGSELLSLRESETIRSLHKRPPFPPSRSPAKRVRDGKGRRKERIRSFRRETETEWSEFLSLRPRFLAGEPSEAGLPRQRRCSGGSELLSLRESETIRSLHRRQIGHVGSHWSRDGPSAVASGS